MSPDSAILKLLGVDASAVSISSSGGGGFATTSKLTVTNDDGSKTSFFLKTGSGPESEVMFAGEHASLNALAIIPQLAPKSIGHGKLSDARKSFLLTEYLDMSGRGGSRASLASKLAKLHTTPAPIPKAYSSPQFGFPVKTCCGSTPQRNDFTSSWADFYANNRLRFIAERSRASNGTDKELDTTIERTCDEVVPRLLGDGHLNQGKGVTPVIVHGDLWSGNASTGILPGMKEPQEVIYDSSACYAHSEYELGIMKMFGGFGKSFLDQYHKICPKTEPVEEYEDRIALYELYHHLNHYAMFGGSYKSGAMSIMRGLLKKYGSKQSL